MTRAAAVLREGLARETRISSEARLDRVAGLAWRPDAVERLRAEEELRLPPTTAARVASWAADELANSPPSVLWDFFYAADFKVDSKDRPRFLYGEPFFTRFRNFQL